MYYNKVILVGRLVREPENIVLPSGTQLSNLVVAYNRNYKDQSGQWKEESHFFEIKVFGNLSVRVVPQLSKGDLILIEGRLHQDKWLDKESGEPRSKIRIVALDIKLISKAGSKSTGGLTPVEEQSDLPAFGEEELLPGEEKKNGSGEDLSELENLLFEGEDKPQDKKDKKEDFDDLDDLFL
jgi:single-strand DNA-binding protein